jgi:hypothetical protein
MQDAICIYLYFKSHPHVIKIRLLYFIVHVPVVIYNTPKLFEVNMLLGIALPA